MAASLSAELLLSLTDDVSGPAKRIASALKNAEAQVKALQASGVTNRLGAQLTKLGASASDIEKVGAAWKTYAASQKLASAASEWTKSQASQVRSWENATVASIRNVTRAEEARTRKQEVALRAASRTQPAGPHAPIKVSGGGHGMFVGPGLLMATKKAVESGAEYQSQIVKMGAAGIPAAEIAAAGDQSAKLAAKYTNVKRSDIMERYRELRSVLTHPDETPHMMEPVIKANAAMNALDRTGHMAEGLNFAVKGAEVLGLAQNPKRFEAYLDSFIKAQQVMGKTITPEQMFEFAKYSKASGSTLSDRFKMTTGVSLGQEMGGATTGVSVDQFVKQVTGGFQGSQHSAAKEFVALGLAKKDDFEKTKTGEIKGLKHGRQVAGARLAQTDPDVWVDKYLMPAFEKAGITDPDAQIAQVRRMFPSGRAADIVSKLITQRESFKNHAKLYGAAQGTDAIKQNQEDPFVALNSMTTSLTNFAGTMTSPIMKDAAKAMSGMASSIGAWGESLAAWQKDHPDAAKLAGGGAVAAGAIGGTVLSYQLLNGLFTGFGLSGSATALTGSAAALTAAAERLALGGGLPDVPGGKTPGGRKVPFVPLLTAATLPLLLGGDTPTGQEDVLRKSVEKQTETWRAGRDFTLGSDKTFGFGSDSSFQPAPPATHTRAGTVPSDMFNFTELKVHAAEAGEAGSQAGGAFRTNLKAQLDQALTDVVNTVAQMRGALNFSASPSITPKFGPAPTVGKGASLDSAASKHAAFADYGFETA